MLGFAFSEEFMNAWMEQDDVITAEMILEQGNLLALPIVATVYSRRYRELDVIWANLWPQIVVVSERTVSLIFSFLPLSTAQPRNDAMLLARR